MLAPQVTNRSRPADIEMISGTAHVRPSPPLLFASLGFTRLTGCGGGWSHRLGQVRTEKRPGGTGSPGCHLTMLPGTEAPVEPDGLARRRLEPDRAPRQGQMRSAATCSSPQDLDIAGNSYR